MISPGEVGSGASEHAMTAGFERRVSARTFDDRKAFQGGTQFRDLVGGETEWLSGAPCDSVWMKFTGQGRQ